MDKAITKAKMIVIKNNLSFSEAIEYIQSGDEGIFIRRDMPIWGDSFIGLFPDVWSKTGKKWLSTIKYKPECGIYAGGGSNRNFSEDDVFAKDWKVYKYEVSEL